MLKRKISGVILLLLLLNILFSISTVIVQAALPPGPYVIRNILAYDSNEHPNTIDEVWHYVDVNNSGGTIPNRTGWSAYKLVCKEKLDGTGNYWDKIEETRTSDSGRDKNYPIAQYRTEILAQLSIDYGANLAEEIYQAALATGESLKYQDGSKTESETVKHYEWYPCNVGERGGYYNNADFLLTLSFTVGGGGTPGGGGEIIGGTCPTPNENVPKRYEHELDVEVSRIDARTVDLNSYTETDVYVSRKSFASSRQAAKAEFNAYIAEIEGMKSECENLIQTWQAEIADLESQKAECEATEPEEVEEGEEAPEPPDCSGFDDDIAQYEEQIAEAETVIQKYNELIGRAQSELAYINANESNYNIVSTTVYLKYDGSNVTSVPVSLSEGQSMARYTFPQWRVTNQGRDIVAQINESGPYQEFQYTNLQSRSAQSLGYNSSLGHVLYSNSSSNNWKDTKQYVATYAGGTCSANSFFQDQTIEGIVRTVNDNGSKRDLKETLTTRFTKLPRTDMRAGYGFEYELSSIYRNNDTEPNPANASGTKSVESYFPTIVNHLPYKRGGAKTVFDLNGNVVPVNGVDEGYKVVMQTIQPSVPRNETKAWLLPPVAIEEFSGNIFSMTNNDHIYHPERNQYDTLITQDNNGNALKSWYVDFTEPDGPYEFRVRSYDAGVNHLNTCHNGKVLIDGSFIGDPNGNDDFVFRSVNPSNGFPAGTGWNWKGSTSVLSSLSNWWKEWLYPNPKDVPSFYHEEKYELPRETILQIREENKQSTTIEVDLNDHFLQRYGF